MLPDYKRRKSDRAFQQYFAVGRRVQRIGLTLPLPVLPFFYLAACVEFPPEAVVVVGVEVAVPLEPSPAVPAC